MAVLRSQTLEARPGRQAVGFNAVPRVGCRAGPGTQDPTYPGRQLPYSRPGSRTRPRTSTATGRARVREGCERLEVRPKVVCTEQTGARTFPESVVPGPENMGVPLGRRAQRLGRDSSRVRNATNCSRAVLRSAVGSSDLLFAIGVKLPRHLFGDDLDRLLRALRAAGRRRMGGVERPQTA
jgi:hypothetical protein